MKRFVFSDEAGDFTFTRNQNASKYFIACAVVLDDCDCGLELLRLRRDLIWNEHPVGDYFHACEDRQIVRDHVFDFIRQVNVKVYAQVLEKSKAQPQIRPTKERFYQHAWFYLFKNCMRRIVTPEDELMITTASVGTKKGQAAFTEAVNDVLTQTVRLPRERWKTSFCPAMADPCLQIADYYTWAIQRKWERGDTRSYDLIKDKVAYEYDLWSHGSKHYY